MHNKKKSTSKPCANHTTLNNTQVVHSQAGQRVHITEILPVNWKKKSLGPGETLKRGLVLSFRALALIHFISLRAFLDSTQEEDRLAETHVSEFFLKTRDISIAHRKQCSTSDQSL